MSVCKYFMQTKIKKLIFEFPESSSKRWSNKNIIEGVIDQKTYGDKFWGVVVDVGANVGSFAVWVSKMPLVREVYAYEPSLLNFEYLKKNIMLNDVKVKIFNFGLGTPGQRELNINDVNCGSFSMYHGEAGKEKIICKSLQSVFTDNNLTEIDWLKCDAEGAEWEFLFEGEALLSKIKNIVMEVHLYKPEWKRETMINLLKRNGFEVETQDAFVNTCFTIIAKKYG